VHQLNQVPTQADRPFHHEDCRIALRRSPQPSKRLTTQACHPEVLPTMMYVASLSVAKSSYPASPMPSQVIVDAVAAGYPHPTHGRREDDVDVVLRSDVASSLCAPSSRCGSILRALG